GERVAAARHVGVRRPVGRHDPEDLRLRPGCRGRGAAGPHPRRAGTPRPPPRGVHQGRGRNDGDGDVTIPELEAEYFLGVYSPRLPVTFVAGEGARLLDEDNREY